MAETIKTIKKSEPRQIKIAAMNALQMEEAGLNFGHNISKLHPKMKQYTAGIKNNIHMIDMEKTAKEFEAALKYIAKIVSEKKTILFVGTKIQMKEIAKTAAEATSSSSAFFWPRCGVWISTFRPRFSESNSSSNSRSSNSTGRWMTAGTGCASE